MKLGKLLIGSGAVGAVAVGGVLLLGGKPEPRDADDPQEPGLPSVTGGAPEEEDPVRAAAIAEMLRLLEASESSTPLLAIGEEDLSFGNAWFNETGSGVFRRLGTGSTGQAPDELLRAAVAIQAEMLGISLEEALADPEGTDRASFLQLTEEALVASADDEDDDVEAPSGDETEYRRYLARRFGAFPANTPASVGEWTEGDLKHLQDLTRIRIVGDTAVAGDFDYFAVLEGAGAMPAFLLDLVIRRNDGQEGFAATGMTELGELLQYFRALLAAGLLEVHGDGSVTASGVGLAVYGLPAEPIVFARTGVRSRLTVRRPDGTSLDDLMQAIERPSSLGEQVYVTVELSTPRTP